MFLYIRIFPRSIRASEFLQILRQLLSSFP
jgi:hypothetical protein